ncbi:hypothetical protein [Nocardia brevicatena]|uniref:hypothetical protein n=1 Tax=Nocardia brevicatena TaxID=37327 RepID=UPI0003160ADF|nr:hypothetical protein [Nocardia brevicatena]
MFSEAFDRRAPELTGLRCAVFVLGDIGYGDTGNRGSEFVPRSSPSGALSSSASTGGMTRRRAADMTREVARAALDIPALAAAG